MYVRACCAGRLLLRVQAICVLGCIHYVPDYVRANVLSFCISWPLPGCDYIHMCLYKQQNTYNNNTHTHTIHACDACLLVSSASTRVLFLHFVSNKPQTHPAHFNLTLSLNYNSQRTQTFKKQESTNTHKNQNPTKNEITIVVFDTIFKPLESSQDVSSPLSLS